MNTLRSGLGIGISILFAVTARAQVFSNPSAIGGGVNLGNPGAANAASIAAGQQFQQDMMNAQQQVAQAQQALSACTLNQGKDNATTRAAQTQAYVNAAQAMAGAFQNPSLGNVVSGALGGDQRQMDIINGRIANIKTAATNYNGCSPPAMNATDSGVSVNSGNATNCCSTNMPAIAASHGGAATAPTATDVPTGTMQILLQQCLNDTRKDAANYDTQMKTEQLNLQNAKGNNSDAIQLALTGTLAGVGAGMALWMGSTQVSADKLNAKDDFTSCTQTAQMQLYNAKAALAMVQQNESQNLLNSQLAQAALANSSAAASTTPQAGAMAGVGLGPATPGSSGPASGSPGSGKNGGSPIGAAGGAPAGADKGVPWSFGSGQPGFPGGGGLPPQPDGAAYAASGAGGGLGASGFGEGAAPVPPGLGMGDDPNGQQQKAGDFALGDGGLNVLLARARARYAAHAVDLVKSVDLKQMAEKEPAKDPPRNPASNTIQKL